VLGAVGDRCY